MILPVCQGLDCCKRCETPEEMGAEMHRTGSQPSLPSLPGKFAVHKRYSSLLLPGDPEACRKKATMAASIAQQLSVVDGRRTLYGG